MALAKRSEFIIKIALFIGIAMFFSEAQATRVSRSLLQSSAIFDVTRFGAKGNGKLAVNEDGDPKNNVAFVRAWRKACDSAGPAKVVIPPGKFVISQVLFGGPCKNPNPIIELQGTVMACKDVSTYYSPGWFLFENVNGISITGSGTFEGQGVINWQNPDSKHLPPSLKINGAAKSAASSIQAIKAVNSKFKA